MRFCFASTRSVQIATGNGEGFIVALILCLHTLRADCNNNMTTNTNTPDFFASTRSVQIATKF